MRKHLTIIALCLLSLSAFCQQKQQVLDYIEQYKQVAIEEMIRTKIPASITLAQGILETGAGSSPLSKQANNHFGIKCKEEWQGKKYYHDDDLPNECFRVYDSARESYADHSDFLLTRPRYAPLFQLPVNDYKSWAYGLKSAGYATNPQYASILIDYIEDYQLAQYDQLALAQMDQKDLLIKKGKPAEEPQQANNSTNSRKDVVIIEDVKPVEHKKTFEENKVVVTEARQEFVVNGVRALKAKGNEDPFTIAFDYNIDYTWIMTFNDLSTGERFKDGEYIYLQPKRNRGSDVTYTVQAGESMRDISQKLGIKLRELYLRNQMRMNDQAYAGEVLYLQEKRTEPPRSMNYAEFLRARSPGTSSSSRSSGDKPPSATALPSPAIADLPKGSLITNAREYQVQQSDTLYSIARKFNTTVDDLKDINQLGDNSLKTGQVLVIAQ
ncbi:MAG: glucosaminidase domain-containing protein [Chitinophagales bacterium]